MDEKKSYRLSRRGILKLGLAAGASVAASAGLPQATLAHDLRPRDPLYQWARYEEIVNRPAIFRQVYQWPNIANPIIFGNVRNGLNGFQFSYGVPADAIQVVVQAYASANAATYDDFLWEKYSWGELLKVDDPTTKQPAKRNIWYHSTVKTAQAQVTPAATAQATPEATPSAEQQAAVMIAPPSDRNDPYYSDLSMEGLQRRGVLFLT